MRVSIGLPFYNNETTLRGAINSILAQSFTDWELILLDDGSSDRSFEIASSFKDPRLRLIKDGQNRGLANRLNQLTKLSQGYYIARMDGDDLMHPDRLWHQVNYLDNHPNVDLVATLAYSIDNNNQILGLKGIEPMANDLKTILLKKGLIIHPTVMAKAEWFRHNPYDSSLRFTEDRELWCRTCAYSVFAKINEPLLFYRESLNKKSFLKKHLLSFKINRDLLRSYGYSALGRGKTNLLISRTYVNTLIIYGLNFFNLYKGVIRKNIKPISSQELAKAQEIINMLS